MRGFLLHTNSWLRPQNYISLSVYRVFGALRTFNFNEITSSITTTPFGNLNTNKCKSNIETDRAGISIRLNGSGFIFQFCEHVGNSQLTINIIHCSPVRHLSYFSILCSFVLFTCLSFQHLTLNVSTQIGNSINIYGNYKYS